MSTDFTVIVFSRQHFGNQPGFFDSFEPNIHFAGHKADFSFDCPDVDPGETAFLMFQSAHVEIENVFQVNGVGVFGALPKSFSGGWRCNILLLEPRHQLKPSGNVLHVGSGVVPGGDLDDFLIDNVVIVYKTRSG